MLGDLLLQRDIYTSDVSDTVFPEDYILQQVVAPLVQRLGRKRRRLERLAYESCVQPWTLLRHRYERHEHNTQVHPVSFSASRT